MDIDTMYNELLRTMEAVSILAENAVRQYSEHELAASLAQSSLELVDRLDEVHSWVSGGGALPGQIQEVQVASARRHIAKALILIAS
jgi:hypothetical protein